MYGLKEELERAEAERIDTGAEMVILDAKPVTGLWRRSRREAIHDAGTKACAAAYVLGYGVRPNSEASEAKNDGAPGWEPILHLFGKTEDLGWMKPSSGLVEGYLGPDPGA